MLRRSFLGLLGAAPIAAPALAKAAFVPEAASSSTALTQWAAYGRASADWFDANSEFIATAGLSPRASDLKAVARAERAEWTARGLDALPSPAVIAGPLPIAGLCLFVDDVGSGP